MRRGSAIGLVVLLSGCGRTNAVPDAHDADQIWEQRCTLCHGSGGHGDGESARGWKVRPRDFSDRAWQGKTSDDDIATIVVQGGLGVGKSALMPGNPDLTGKPEVVRALVQKVRAFGR